MKGLLSAVVLLASGALAPRVDVSVAPRELTIGDRAEVTVSVRIDSEVPSGAVDWPEWESTLGSAEILEVGPVETTTLANGDRILTRRLGVAFFNVGEAVIPSMGVEVSTPAGPTMLATDAVPVAVVSVLPEGEEEIEARPPSPPQSLAMGEPFWWASGALLATCLAALVLLARQANPGTSSDDLELVLSPRQELSRSLEALRRERDTATLHEGMSMTTRRYIGRVLGFAGPESTTSEVGRELRRQQVDPEVTRRTQQLLATCDMVMFARREVDLEQGLERLDEVEGIAGAVDGWLAATRAEVEASEGESTEEVAG